MVTHAEPLHTAIDDFTDPWERSDTVVMIHGLAESGQAFRSWVPYLSRHYKVVRLDLRGFGGSPRVPRDFPWSLDCIMHDLEAVLDRLALDAVHLIGAKIGGTFALQFAASRPNRVHSLVLASAPANLTGLKEQTVAWREQIAREGVKAWAKATMRARMGSRMGERELAWWADLMGETPAATLEGFLQMVPTVDVRDRLPEIATPTLVLASQDSPLEPVEVVRTWAAAVPRATMEVLPGNSYHLAAAEPDACALLAQRFLRQLG